MYIYTITKSNLSNLILAFLYGIFIVNLIQVDLNNNSGDIQALLKYFNTFNNLEYFREFHTFQVHDYVFRYAVIYLHEFFNISFLNLLKIQSFIISFIIMYIFLNSYKPKKRNLFLSLMALMVFFTPNVWDLWASGIRSGIAFVVLFFSLIYLRGFIRYVAFITSIYIHLSMLPIIFFYFLFYFLKNKKINLSIIIFLYVLILASFSFNIIAQQVDYVNAVSQSIYYQALISFTVLVLIFINKGIVRNLYGFLGVGTIFIVLLGFLFDYSFIRYVGNFFVFYLFFLIQEEKVKISWLSCLAYFPFFSLATYYSVANLS